MLTNLAVKFCFGNATWISYLEIINVLCAVCALGTGWSVTSNLIALGQGKTVDANGKVWIWFKAWSTLGLSLIGLLYVVTLVLVLFALWVRQAIPDFLKGTYKFLQ